MTHRIKIASFSLKDTMECGQFFRYTKFEDIYTVQSGDRVFSLQQKGPYVFFEGVDESTLVRFFRLEDDFESIMRDIERDPVVREARRRYPGLRLIRQDPWECLVSFLCSSAKAISHIRVVIENLCRSSGRKILCGNTVTYGFPEPSCIQHREQLEPVRAGFRAPYLLHASRCMDRQHLLGLRDLSYDRARADLMRLPGVGKKVADCTLLYSLDFLEAFPIDTWIKKGLQKVYFRGTQVGEKTMEQFVNKHFGPYAGYAQLYLYYHWRQHLA